MKRHLQDIDVAKTKINDALRLDRVGMSNIECPILIKFDNRPPCMASARADAFVSLDEPQKGIHMSRLFIALTEVLEAEPISPATLANIASSFLKSHEGISHSAHVKVNFEMMLKRPALLSDNEGWRSYPISLWATATKNGVQTGVELTIRYSSTCPCSAALARQLIQNKFAEDFAPAYDLTREAVLEWLGKEDSIAGTPHGQRSEGKVTAILAAMPGDLSFVVSMIERLESALKTPVQSAVKREDEQEFARLNASNLMFAEDAVRRLSAALNGDTLFKGIACEVAHLESLHPHDAVAKVATGELADNFWR
jgi:GTP cyclohydrolase I